MDELSFARDMLDFIYAGPTQFHVAARSAGILKKAGFKELQLEKKWKISEKGAYFVRINSSMIIAFRVNSTEVEKEGFRIIGAHSDSPAIKIKPSPEIVQSDNYLKLNAEIYGGPILNTWLDRPLALAGRVSVRSNDLFHPTENLVNINKPVGIIPNQAIHVNKDVNKGIELNKQKDMLPLIQLAYKDFPKEKFLVSLIADQLECEKEDILSFELYLYEYEKGSIIGLKNEFISSPRLDNQSMVYAGLSALTASEGTAGINVAVFFDNEEIGSRTRQGAGSPLFASVLERITLALGKKRDDYFRGIANSFMISADLSHALHPNAPDKTDPTNKPCINGGPVIKIHANQSYINDSMACAVYKELCRKADIPVQIFTPPSDTTCGSTIGPISSTQVPIKSLDMGNAILAMHSCRELGGVKDLFYAYKSFTEFYSI